MDLDELLTAQGGVVTREQALTAGVSGRQLRPGERRLVRVRRGVYADATLLGLADEGAATALQVAAARLASAVDLIAAGETAALVHGLPVLGPRPARLHLAERRPARPQHHGASTTLRPDEVITVRGVPVTDLARTAADVARHRGFLSGVVIADAVLARGVSRDVLETALVGRDRWPGARAAVQAIAFADGRSESALESVGRVGFAQAGLPPPELQVVLCDEDGPFARVDQYWKEYRTVAEADGALKYRTPADLFEEKRREDRMRDLGEEVVRYTWEEALRRPQLLAARMRRAFVRSARRHAA